MSRTEGYVSLGGDVEAIQIQSGGVENELLGDIVRS